MMTFEPNSAPEAPAVDLAPIVDLTPSPETPPTAPTENKEINAKEIEIELVMPAPTASTTSTVPASIAATAVPEGKHPMKHAADAAKDLSASLDKTLKHVEKKGDVVKSAPAPSTSEKPTNLLDGLLAGM